MNTDGGRHLDSVVGGAWWRSDGKFGARRLSTGATVSNGEVAGIEDGIRNCSRGPVWILSNSKAAIVAMVNAGHSGRASIGSLANAVVRIMYRVRKRGEGAMMLC